jgi:uncharacterized membrane protein
MKLEDYKIVFIAVGLIGVLLFASPTIGLFLKLPAGEAFSELYILGPEHMVDDIPFNIRANVSYLVYLGVGNQMGSSEYYTCYVKLRNLSEPLPNSTLGTPSSLPVLYEFKAFIQDGQTWETPLTFKVNSLNFSNKESQIQSITINGDEFAVNKTAVWNAENKGYYYDFFIELWIFNSPSETLQYHNRLVHFQLNVTETT